MTREEWLLKFLTALDAPDTTQNRVAMVSWIASEGGAAKWNPLNTTKRMDGSTAYNSIGVQNYVSLEQGLLASIATIKEEGKGYDSIRRRLHASSWPSRTLAAIYASQWGTQKIPFLLRSVKRSYDFYADQPIGS